MAQRQLHLFGIQESREGSRVRVPVAPPVFVRDDVEVLATKRQALHDRTGNNSRRFFPEDRIRENRIGVSGELQFEREFGYKADRSRRAWGDNGIDFITPLGVIDVKTAQIPVFLFVKTHQLHRADFYVLGKYHEDRTVTFLGWATREEMSACPRRDFGYGIENYYKPAKDLHPMEELKNLLGFWSVLGE